METITGQLLIAVCVLAIALVLAGCPNPSKSTPPPPSGSLDTSFATGTGANGAVYSMAVQSNGQILIGGSFTSYNGTPCGGIARLNADGTVDATFAANAGTGANGAIFSVAVQSNGQILIGGSFSFYGTTGVGNIARLNADGTVDATFATNEGSGANGAVRSVVVQSNGQILIGGAFTSYNGPSRGHIARLNTDGSLDTTLWTAAGSGANGAVYSVAVQSNGQILIGGSFTSYNGPNCGGIARLNTTDGSLDATLNTTTGANGAIFSVAVQSNGQILIGGSFTSYNSTSCGYVARLNTNGSLDTSFVTTTGANNAVYSVAVQSNGQVLIGGAFTTYNSASCVNIARLNTNGSLDASLATGTGTGGAATPVYSVAVQGNGEILIGGNFTSYNGTSCGGIARLWN